MGGVCRGGYGYGPIIHEALGQFLGGGRSIELSQMSKVIQTPCRGVCVTSLGFSRKRSFFAPVARTTASTCNKPPGA